jgi:hypothetical protein
MTPVKRATWLFAVPAILLGGVAAATAGPITSDLPSSAYITVNGLDWAWASPVASTDWGGNTLQEPGFHSGWRYATEAELANRPSAYDFLIDSSHSDPNYGGYLANVRNAAAYWNSTFTHIDFGDGVNGYVRSTPDGSSYESWYVRDSLAATPVPEPTSFVVFCLTAVTGAGYYYLRRRKQSATG